MTLPSRKQRPPQGLSSTVKISDTLAVRLNDQKALAVEFIFKDTQNSHAA
jgi:hypothetical protein